MGSPSPSTSRVTLGCCVPSPSWGLSWGQAWDGFAPRPAATEGLPGCPEQGRCGGHGPGRGCEGGSISPWVPAPACQGPEPSCPRLLLRAPGVRHTHADSLAHRRAQRPFPTILVRSERPARRAAAAAACVCSRAQVPSDGCGPRPPLPLLLPFSAPQKLHLRLVHLCPGFTLRAVTSAPTSLLKYRPARAFSISRAGRLRPAASRTSPSRRTDAPCG